jgi:hypothetical protein
MSERIAITDYKGYQATEHSGGRQPFFNLLYHNGKISSENSPKPILPPAIHLL